MSYLSYHFVLGTSDGWAIRVTAGSSAPDHAYPELSPIFDESPQYIASSYFKWPDYDLRIGFGPGASSELIDHAFDVRLNCTWGLRGCRNVGELMPNSLKDKRAIEQRALSRLRSSEPCPDSILPRRVRDIPTILLVQVEHAVPIPGQPNDVLVDYKLLQVLKKGSVWRPLKGVEHFAEIPSLVDRSMIRNPVFDLLRTGERFIMFAYVPDAQSVYAPCEIIPATDSALAAIRSATAAKAKLK